MINRKEQSNPHEGPKDGFKLEVKKSVVNGKQFVIQLKYTAPQEAFSYIDALTHFGNFPAVEQYVEDNFQRIIDGYCAEAKARLTAAAKPDFIPRKHRKNRTDKDRHSSDSSPPT